MARNTTARTAATKAAKTRSAPVRSKKKPAATLRTRAAKRAPARRKSSTTRAVLAKKTQAAKKRAVAKSTARTLKKSRRTSATQKKSSRLGAKKRRSVKVRSIPIRLSAAPPEKCFWVHEGPVLSSIADLSQALKIMPPHQFLHHVNSEKNDFARWVEDVFGETMLARRLRRTKTLAGAYRVVQSFVSLHR